MVRNVPFQLALTIVHSSPLQPMIILTLLVGSQESHLTLHSSRRFPFPRSSILDQYCCTRFHNCVLGQIIFGIKAGNSYLGAACSFTDHTGFISITEGCAIVCSSPSPSRVPISARTMFHRSSAATTQHHGGFSGLIQDSMIAFWNRSSSIGERGTTISEQRAAH